MHPLLAPPDEVMSPTNRIVCWCWSIERSIFHSPGIHPAGRYVPSQGKAAVQTCRAVQCGRLSGYTIMRR